MKKHPHPEFLNPAEKHHGHKKHRLFEAGQMKLLVLYFIAQSPKYGYDIIKDVGELVGGGYSPSAGTIYPTLSYLEDMQWIRVEVDTDQRKQYHISTKGTAQLNEQQEQIEHILGQLELRKKIRTQEEYGDIKRAMENLKMALRMRLHQEDVNPDEVRKIAEQIDQIAVNISRL